MAGVFDNTVGMTTSKNIYKKEEEKPKEEIKETKKTKKVNKKKRG